MGKATPYPTMALRGNAATFLGLCEDQESMHPAGKGALDLFERFIDRK